MRAFVVIAAMLLAAPAYGLSEVKCLASYDNDGAWSRERRVDVEFLATRELYPDEQRRFPIFARIWFTPDEPAIVMLDGTSLATPQFFDSALEKLFHSGEPVTGRERDNPQRWRVRCVTEGHKWVDSRYPDAFDPQVIRPYRR